MAILRKKIPNPINPAPMIKRPIVGAATPATGVADPVAGVADGVAVALAVAFSVAVGLGVGVCVPADGVVFKAGPSAAWTIKVLVRVRKIPLASRHLTVILCVPASRLSGGVQSHS